LGIDRMFRVLDRQRRAQIKNRIEAGRVDPLAHCKCLINTTRKETRQAYTWWISSLAFVENIGVGDSFYDVLTGLEQKSICGGRKR